MTELLKSRSWRIKVVYRGTPNADGFWVRCGHYALPKRMRFAETCQALKRHCPRDHEIVAVDAK
jgi:hypothetical protein